MDVAVPDRNKVSIAFMCFWYSGMQISLIVKFVEQIVFACAMIIIIL